MNEIVVHEREVTCNGELGDHPKVYYKIGDEGFAVCGYCGIRFIYIEQK
tara:strand:- start:6551 stop:6697 length:147 start_codon:yes stop_codon:yes gene_type:complete